LDLEPEHKAEMELVVRKNEESQKRRAFLLKKRFDVVAIFKIKWLFVTIDSSILHAVMKETSREFDVSK
jgi:glyoxylate utilization-related uncharacterized protein